MGSDIHVVLEVQHEGGWLGLHDFPDFALNHVGKIDYIPGPEATQRSYKRFAALAGNRGPGPSPRGLPVNASPLARYLLSRWGPNAHHVSWYPLKEALPIFIATANLEEGSHHAEFPCGYIFGVSQEEIDKYRIVFWFDC